MRMWMEVVDTMGSGSSSQSGGGTSDQSTAEDQVTYDDLVMLIRWLALPYGKRSPIFALEDWQGNPLPANRRIATAWHSIMGVQPERSDNAWVICPICGGATVRTAIMEETHV